MRSEGDEPVSYVVLVHKFDALVNWKMNGVMRAHETHLTYLGKKSDKLSEGLKPRVVIWTQQGVDKNWGIIG